MPYVPVGQVKMTVSPEAIAAAARATERVTARRPGEECPAGTGTGYVLDAGGFWRRARCGEKGQAAPAGARVLDWRGVAPGAPTPSAGIPFWLLAAAGGGAIILFMLLRRRRKAQATS